MSCRAAPKFIKFNGLRKIVAQDGDKLLSQLRNFSLIPQRCLTDCQSLGGDQSKSWEYLTIVARSMKKFLAWLPARKISIRSKA